MRIAIDIIPLESGHRNRGVGTYTKLLIESLQKYESDHTYSFFTRGQKVPENVDVVHYPYFDPFFLTLPVITSRPTVVTVHDLIPLVFPEHFPAGVRGRLKWQVQRLSLGRTTRIITDSHASKRDIIRIAGIGSHAIDVVRLAPADVFHPVTDKVLLQTVTTKYKLPERFILYVGDINWNKNILGMLEAFSMVKSLKSKVKSSNQELKQDVKLVLVGKAFIERSPEANAIQASIDALGIRDRVIMPGFVPFDDLSALYSLASVYVQPSHYEGFGLPILEAFVCGCPVISSRSPGLSEIAGPAIMVDPNNHGDLATRLEEALAMPAARRLKLIQDGILWARQFSWKLVAHQTVQSYEKSVA